MNREELIGMARVAGCHDNGEEFRFVELRYLERFAALVAAAERESVIDICEKWAKSGGDYSLLDAIRTRGEK